MIPVLLGAAAIWGISNLEEAERKARDAREIDAQAAKIAEDAQAKVEASHEKMKGVLTELGKRKMYLMKGNVTDVANFMHNLNKKFRLYHDTEGLRELEKNGITEETLKEVTTLSQNTLELAASTDFKHDVDGSLGALGALGGAVLGFGAIAAPALLIYGFMKSDEATKILYEAKTRLDKANYYAERSKNISALFNAIATRGTQMNDLLFNLNRYFDPAVEKLKEVNRLNKDNYNLKSYPLEHQVAIFYAWQIMETVKTIINVSMIHEDWSINPDIEQPIEIGEKAVALLSE